jgi:hypothetical protein
MRMQSLPVEDDSQLWEEAAEKARAEGAKLREHLEREKREQERLRAEQEAIEAKRKLELFVFKSTLPYTEPLAQEICERISCGELLICICNDDHLPTTRRCKQWLNEHDDFAMLYKDSLNDRLDIFEEQVIQIADDASRDFKEVVRNGRTVRVLDGEAIARAKLRVETRIKYLRAFKPERWAEAQTLNVKSQDALDCSNLSSEELERRLADLDAKDRIMKVA